MFAVMETGGKQYKVSVGDEVLIEKLEAQVGDKIAFDVLMLEKEDGTTVFGTPVVSDVKVNAEVLEHGKADKIIVYKYQSKEKHRSKNGHRQPYTKIKINEIG